MFLFLFNITTRKLIIAYVASNILLLDSTALE